jgi:hypothetical protein
MISLEEYKKAFGKKLLAELSEEQILKVREQQDQMAELFYQIWIEKLKENSSNN